ncbi:FAD binding domain-containing protein [Bailinhaonella thermotolerans]|uniref:FAD binding domain-containing protein n=1 Tax=Bailinhaonella thermotolerans TaxID=1070861 RepID=UPI00192A1E76|nr:FAD binding domain-containing protein [Bailinhaonella thermotolerans]
MKPASFTYHAPTAAAEASALLAELGPAAAALAGGQSLVPELAARRARFAHLVDLNRVAELAGITLDGDELRVGSMTRQRDAERSTEVREAAPLLALALPWLGPPQVRNRGTVGGALAQADPAGDLPAVAVALGALLELGGPAGTVPAGARFTGARPAPGPLLTAARFPRWPAGSGFGFERVAPRAAGRALAGAAVALAPGAACRIVLYGVTPAPARPRAAEELALAGAPAEEVARAALRDLGLLPGPPDEPAVERSGPRRPAPGGAGDGGREEVPHGGADGPDGSRLPRGARASAAVRGRLAAHVLERALRSARESAGA